MKKILLVLVWVAATIHFLKDITQDFLKVSSPLDTFGNITENLTWLPRWGQDIYLYGLGGLSVIAEVILMYTIPFVIFDKGTQIKYKLIKCCFIYLFIFFAIAILLDPRITSALK
jgi:hypothetical protein